MQKATVLALFLIMEILWGERNSWAQLVAGKDAPIVYGHHHINVSDVGAHHKFWIDALGGKPARIPGRDGVIKFPNVFVYPSQRPPTGSSKGTTFDHIAFQVPNVRAAVEKVKATGYPIVTKAELSTMEVKDDVAFVANEKTYVAFTVGPDETKVELVENKSMKEPVALHHIHFSAPDVAAMKAWYVKVFNATPSRRGSFEAAELPGVTLVFSQAPGPVVGTVGRALDHIGFEIKGLVPFCKQLNANAIKLEPHARQTADAAPGCGVSPVTASPLKTAILFDPWGTRIELTEGMATW
jgi:catechol 2,3-dioxygenase-like lactoylglutathione lyase family enzyme/predicted enzyme related to lactoylglutathione lyase